MSEPMTSVEIEDVLSSIRRLVSEDLRPVTRIAAPLPVVAEPAPGEKLILTPALRVVPSVVRVAVVDVPPAADAPDVVVAFGFADAIETALDRDHADDVQDLPDDVGPRAVIPADASLPDASPPDSSIEAVVAVVGAGVGAQDNWDADEWDADTDADVMAQANDPWHSAGWHTPEAILHRADPAWMPEAELIAEAELVRDEERLRDGPMPDDDDTQAWPESHGWAPEDDAEATVTPHPAMALPLNAMQRRLADIAEAAAVAEILGAVDAPDAAVRADGGVLPDASALADDTVLDETHLRDLVRDIIREELQGSLGERITRNVRKLVRAEINRALATRDFD